MHSWKHVFLYTVSSNKWILCHAIPLASPKDDYRVYSSNNRWIWTMGSLQKPNGCFDWVTAKTEWLFWPSTARSKQPSARSKQSFSFCSDPIVQIHLLLKLYCSAWSSWWQSSVILKMLISSRYRDRNVRSKLNHVIITSDSFQCDVVTRQEGYRCLLLYQSKLTYTAATSHWLKQP